MSEVFQVLGVSWIIFSMFLISRVSKWFRVIICDEVYYSAKGLQLTIVLLAVSLIISQAIF